MVADEAECDIPSSVTSRNCPESDADGWTNVRLRLPSPFRRLRQV